MTDKEKARIESALKSLEEVACLSKDFAMGFHVEWYEYLCELSRARELRLTELTSAREFKLAGEAACECLSLNMLLNSFRNSAAAIQDHLQGRHPKS